MSDEYAHLVELPHELRVLSAIERVALTGERAGANGRKWIGVQ